SGAMSLLSRGGTYPAKPNASPAWWPHARRGPFHSALDGEAIVWPPGLGLCSSCFSSSENLWFRRQHCFSGPATRPFSRAILLDAGLGLDLAAGPSTCAKSRRGEAGPDRAARRFGKP